MAKPTINIDIDGVLANFVRGVFKWMNKPNREDEVRRWDFFPDFGIDAGAFWRSLNPTFWETLEPYPWAGALIDECNKIAEVRYITSTGECVHAASAKQRWMKHHFGVKPSHVFTCAEKWRFSTSDTLLIDDYIENWNKYMEGDGLAILFKQPWNESSYNPVPMDYEATVRSARLWGQMVR